MTFNYPKHFITPMRRALMDFAASVRPTHDLTLNFHDTYKPEPAQARVGSWYREMMRRMFGRRWFARCADEMFAFVAFPEASFAGHAHFHCAARIPVTHLDYFMRVAPLRWKARVPTGTLFLQPIVDTDDDRENVSRYITKSSSASALLHSSMLWPTDQGSSA